MKIIDFQGAKNALHFLASSIRIPPAYIKITIINLSRNPEVGNNFARLIGQSKLADKGDVPAKTKKSQAFLVQKIQKIF